MYRAALMAGLLVMLPCALSACADDEIKRPDVTAPLMPELGPEGTEGTISLSQIESSTPFTAGTGANSYRIPSIVTAGEVRCWSSARRAMSRGWTRAIRTSWYAAARTTGRAGPRR